MRLSPRAACRAEKASRRQKLWRDEIGKYAPRAEWRCQPQDPGVQVGVGSIWKRRRRFWDPSWKDSRAQMLMGEVRASRHASVSEYWRQKENSRFPQREEGFSPKSTSQVDIRRSDSNSDLRGGAESVEEKRCGPRSAAENRSHA